MNVWTICVECEAVSSPTVQKMLGHSRCRRCGGGTVEWDKGEEE